MADRRLLLKKLPPWGNAVAVDWARDEDYAGMRGPVMRVYDEWAAEKLPMVVKPAPPPIVIKRPKRYEDDIPSIMREQIDDRDRLSAEMYTRRHVKAMMDILSYPMPSMFIGGRPLYANKTLLLKRKKSCN